MSADAIFNALIYISLVPSFLFVVLYAFTTPWYRSDIGISLFSSAVGLFIMLAFSALYHLFGPGYFGRDVVRIGGMSWVFVGVSFKLTSLIRVKRRALRED